MTMTARWRIEMAGKRTTDAGRVTSWAVGAERGAGPHNVTVRNPTRDEPLQLAGNWKLTWGWPEDTYPGPKINPTTVTCSIRVRTAADVPEIDQGDDVDVWLMALAQRTGYDEVLTYFHDQVMTVDDVNLRAGRAGLVLDLVLVDKLGVLAETNVGAVPFPAGQLPSERLQAIARAGGFNLSFISRYMVDWVRLGFVDVDNHPALDLLHNTLAGVLYEDTDPVVLRPSDVRPDWVDPGMVTADPERPEQLNGWYPQPERALTYVLQRVRTKTTTAGLPYRFRVTGNRMGYELVPNVVNLPRRLVVPAKAVDLGGTSWRKSREDSTNQVRLTGLTFAGEDASGVAKHPELVRRYGPNERVVESHTESDYADVANVLPDLAAKLLPDYDAALPQWSLPEFTIDTRALSDAELEQIVTKLWPRPAFIATTESIEMPVMLQGVGTPWRVGGKVDVHGVLTGAELAISDDELTITGQLKGHVLRPASDHPDAPTWAGVRADASWSKVRPRTAAAGELIVDPELTYADLRLIGL